MKKTDVISSLIIGETIAIFVLIILKIAEKFSVYFWGLLILLPLLCALGLWIAFLIGRRWPVIIQFARFILVGALNTAIDFGVLNILLAVSGITAGLFYAVFKGVSALCSMTNSFFWNKLWTFGKSKIEDAPKELPRFLLVTLIGLAANVSIASFVVNFIPAPIGIGPKTWANIGAIIATLIGFLWNFLGFKFIAFKA